MTGTYKACRIFVFLLLCLGAPAFAQQSQPSILAPFEIEHGPGPDPTQGMIRLDVSATDKSGNPVSGLEQYDFTLRDNNQPEKIVSLRAFDGGAGKPDPPITVILVIDELNMPYAPPHGTAGSLSPEQIAESFLRQNQGRLSQPVSVYRVTNDGVTASTQGSLDGNAIAGEIASRSERRFIWKAPMISESLGRLLQVGTTVGDSGFVDAKLPRYPSAVV